jgi:hypothetical protein
MKKIIYIAMLMVIPTSIFGQQTPSVQTDYLQKTKNQKTAGFVLLAGGSALIITGFLIGDSKSSSFGDAATGAVLGGVGVLSALGSIPLFIASAKNKRRANNASTFFKMEKIPVIQHTSLVSRSYPSITVKINL